MTTDILNTVEQYYKEQKDKYDTFISDRKIKKHRIYYNENKKAHIIDVIGTDDNKVFSAEFEYIGIHDKTLRVWKWAWCIGYINTELKKKAEEIKKYTETIKKNYTHEQAHDLDIIYYMLNTGYFFVEGNDILKLVKLSLWITKGYWFIPLVKQEENQVITEYILIKKIISI